MPTPPAGGCPLPCRPVTEAAPVFCALETDPESSPVQQCAGQRGCEHRWGFWAHRRPGGVLWVWRRPILAVGRSGEHGSVPSTVRATCSPCSWPQSRPRAQLQEGPIPKAPSKRRAGFLNPEMLAWSDQGWVWNPGRGSNVN